MGIYFCSSWIALSINHSFFYFVSSLTLNSPHSQGLPWTSEPPASTSGALGLLACSPCLVWHDTILTDGALQDSPPRTGKANPSNKLRTTWAILTNWRKETFNTSYSGSVLSSPGLWWHPVCEGASSHPTSMSLGPLCPWERMTTQLCVLYGFPSLQMPYPAVPAEGSIRLSNVSQASREKGSWALLCLTFI